MFCVTFIAIWISIVKGLRVIVNPDNHHHHQLINAPSARAQALLMDYTQGKRAITHHSIED
jgi:hypothetical protein